MAQKYWFKARKYGVGWTPSTWKGWIVLLLYIAILVYSFTEIDRGSHSVSDTLINFFPKFLTFTALLTVITYLTGEPTTWHHEKVKSSEESKKE